MEHDLLAQKRTAYALGELDPAERAVIGADLARSEAHRLEVEEIRALAAAVSGALAMEKKPVLSEIQHLAIESTLQQMTEDHEALAAARLRRQRIAFWLPTALAACALLASGITLFILSHQQGGAAIDSPSSPGEIAVNGIGTGLNSANNPNAVRVRVNEVIRDYNQYIRISPPLGAPAVFAPHVDHIVASDAATAHAFHPTTLTPLSSFPLSVDVGMYNFVKECLQRGGRPPTEIVHVDAMINAYSYEDAGELQPEKALAVKTEVSDCPWNSGHKLARVLVKAKDTGEPAAVVAEGVRVRVEFNPHRVASFRLIGYENRGAEGSGREERTDLKSGHTITALYEIVPIGNFGKAGLDGDDLLKYQKKPQLTTAAQSDELFTVQLKYDTDTELGLLVEASGIDAGLRLVNTSQDFRFAAAVAQFGLVLLDSPSKGQGNLESVRNLAKDALGADITGDRAKFLRLVEQAQTAVN